MTLTKKHKKQQSQKRKKIRSHRNKKNTNTKKIHKDNKDIKRAGIIILPNKTPQNIDEISQDINDELEKSSNTGSPVASYSPSINEELVSLVSAKRQPVYNCNNEKAFLLKAPLQIGIPGYIYGKYCYPYNSPEAKKFLLKSLKANKHVDPEKIIPPIQSLGNCWFNTMFVTLFISDKGRKFFHFFRQLMIEGKQRGNQLIPEKLRDGFALLNYAIDACLTGNKYAYILNTNTIIKQVYDAIPADYKERFRYIKDIDEAGNPMRYYLSLINYLNNKDLEISFFSDLKQNWQDKIVKETEQKPIKHSPHVIILEFFDDEKPTTNKPTSFYLNNNKYTLDSCVIRDTNQQHFSSLLTCESKEMAYDGMSYHRLVFMDWKKYINTEHRWQFKGSEDEGKKLTWNFMKGYMLLIYYRT
jgi:hypothetical protein